MKYAYLYLLKVTYFLLLCTTDFVVYLHWKLWKYSLDQHDIVNSSIPTSDVKIESHDGFHHVTATHIKKKSNICEVILENGMRIECADHHLITTPFGYSVPAIDLKKGEYVAVRDNTSKVKLVKKKRYKTFMFDITVASQDHLYYTNDIISHNSIISAIFIVWYLLTNSERNVLLVSQSGNKVKELMSKIEIIIKGLPFYMKPGMITNNVMTKIFDSGCKLVAETTTDKSGASFTIHLLYADEFALVHHSYIKEFYRTIFPTLSSSDISRMIITSTPRGMNKFYEIYNSAIKSENRFNPMRVDWYEVPLSPKDLKERGFSKKEIEKMIADDTVPMRDEKWKSDQVLDLGTEEDFNQEFGNQFLAGNTLLFRHHVLKRLKKLQTKFIHYDIEIFDANDVEYEGCMTWHPQFDIMQIQNKACQFTTTIDLGDGSGGNYTVVNIFQILPMSKSEIDNLKIFTDDKDFFKMVQIGIYRTNIVSLPDVAKMFYHLVTDIFIQDNIKTVLELNHEGNYFRKLVETMYGDENVIEDDHIWVKFKFKMGDEKSQIWKPGLNNQEKIKDYGCKVIKDKVKYNQMVLIEHMTVEESLSFTKNKSGKYESQTGNNDCIMTCVNLTHYYETTDFVEQIEEIINYTGKEFKKELDLRLNRFIDDEDEDDDYADLMEML